ncbi:MAG: DNA gyrase subunit A [Anaerolineae bacterium]|nr:DNA gyrase subunit A [Anaerolineae bacterium]
MEIGTVRQVDIVDEMRDAYLDYAMSVITSRALPDVRDGLKPVQRRILFAMGDMGLRHNQPHKKSARIVGEVLGKYHPHSDKAVYDAMVRMAQDFTLRYPLVDGHGNFGSIDGDDAAAIRYTEARLALIAEEMLADIDKDTVDFTDNFDGTLKEPTVLPSRLPNLLVNGAAGIAVGMATNIPPHNLAEVCDAICYLIDRYDEIDEVTVEDLMRYIKGPDFPTGGSVLGREGIVAAYATGKGRIVVRARAHVEELKGGRTAIIVTELPYEVNKATLVERIAELARNRRIETISDLRDESDRTGMRIVIELKRGADVQTTLNQLLKWTSMQATFGVNMLALVDGEPRVLSLKRMLQLFIEHRRVVITRRSRFELEHAKDRAHILEGLKIAVSNLDEVISIIRRSRDADTALVNLRRRFKLSEVQARAILDMPLRRLTALERQKIEDELAQVRRQIAYLEDLLAHPRKILALVQEEMAELRRKYGDARRTRIAEEETAEFSAEDLIPSEEVFLVVTQRGYVRRVSARSYRARGRGGAPSRDDDPAVHALPASTMDSALFFTDRGRVFQEKVHQMPDESRQPRGVPLASLIGLENGESVTGVVAVSDMKHSDYILMVTALGKVKRSTLQELSTARTSAMTALGLDDGDALRVVRRTSGGQEVILVTGQGKAIRFSEEEIRPTGRTAGGVLGIRLAEGDEVVAADLVRPGSQLLIATRSGYAKRTPMDEYPVQARGGSGVLTFEVSRLAQCGTLTAARVVSPEEDVVLISAEGLVLRTPVAAIPEAARTARGQRLLELRGKDRLVAIVGLTRTGEGVPAAPEAGEPGAPEEASEAPAEPAPATRRRSAGSSGSRAKETGASTGKARATTRAPSGRSRKGSGAGSAGEQARPRVGRGRAGTAAKAGDSPAEGADDKAVPKGGRASPAATSGVRKGSRSQRTSGGKRRSAKGPAGEDTNEPRAAGRRPARGAAEPDAKGGSSKGRGGARRSG